MIRGDLRRRSDALAIWQAGLEAVKSDRLIAENFFAPDDRLLVNFQEYDLRKIDRIAVVGAGKAGAGMAAEVEAQLGSELLAVKRVDGWLNVPADCLRTLDRIHLHAARPAGVNEPTVEGVQGSDEILRIVSQLTSRDLCLCLLSGGGSALLPAPVTAITLADKAAITRHLSAAGANIQELNAVRKQLSRIKGGGLARACNAGTLVTLIISDVLGDPLDVIASGPTVPDPGTAAQAVAVLDRFGARELPEARNAYAYLERQTNERRPPPKCAVRNIVIGNNAAAVDAAGTEAVRLGYSPVMISSCEMEGTAESVAAHLAEQVRRMRDGLGPDCLITGGEPVVQLAPASMRGKGGRNQQLVLAAIEELRGDLHGVTLLSGGTDGEDGPTDAAGAWADESLVAAARERGLVAADYMRRNDAYNYFAPLDGLIKTGPTHTNVCDVRVVLVDRGTAF